eukprot:SAG31_NODE_1902_length_6956_cov_5.312236_4_plen_720_part_00
MMAQQGGQHSLVHLQLAAMKLKHDAQSLLFFKHPECDDDAVSWSALAIGIRHYAPVCGATLRAVRTSATAVLLTGEDGESVTITVGAQQASSHDADGAAALSSSSSRVAVAMSDDSSDVACDESDESNHNTMGKAVDQGDCDDNSCAIDLPPHADRTDVSRAFTQLDGQPGAGEHPAASTELRQKLQQSEAHYNATIATLRSECAAERRRATAMEEQLRRQAEDFAAGTEANLAVIEQLQGLLASERQERAQVDTQLRTLQARVVNLLAHQQWCALVTTIGIFSGLVPYLLRSPWRPLPFPRTPDRQEEFERRMELRVEERVQSRLATLSENSPASNHLSSRQLPSTPDSTMSKSIGINGPGSTKLVPVDVDPWDLDDMIEMQEACKSSLCASTASAAQNSEDNWRVPEPASDKTTPTSEPAAAVAAPVSAYIQNSSTYAVLAPSTDSINKSQNKPKVDRQEYEEFLDDSDVNDNPRAQLLASGQPHIARENVSGGLNTSVNQSCEMMSDSSPHCWDEGRDRGRNQKQQQEYQECKRQQQRQQSHPQQQLGQHDQYVHEQRRLRQDQQDWQRRAQQRQHQEEATQQRRRNEAMHQHQQRHQETSQSRADVKLQAQRTSRSATQDTDKRRNELLVQQRKMQMIRAMFERYARRDSKNPAGVMGRKELSKLSKDTGSARIDSSYFRDTCEAFGADTETGMPHGTMPCSLVLASNDTVVYSF